MNVSECDAKGLDDTRIEFVYVNDLASELGMLSPLTGKGSRTFRLVWDKTSKCRFLTSIYN